LVYLQGRVKKKRTIFPKLGKWYGEGGKVDEIEEKTHVRGM
jgi:hypothetical protein